MSTSDPMERLIEDALISAGIEYEAGHKVANHLDFHLPVYGVHIEVKRFHSDRIGEQMSRAPNVIALQGELAVRMFAEMLVAAR